MEIGTSIIKKVNFYREIERDKNKKIERKKALPINKGAKHWNKWGKI